jgi:hypothetical protein
MPHLEPTYLRYIYDGLIKGSIHPENAAELPEGLIGLYEEAFDEKQPVHLRQQLLERFAIWALLKMEVSAQFIAEVLNQPEEDIQEFIATYSAWFNSPESGKYQLYHERLKVYLLQKLSEGEVHALHEKLISRLEQAIEEQKADEFEWYGLEFLARHLGISSMLNGDGRKLLNLAYSQSHWQRQLKISKGYTWTKNGLSSVMSWASKHNDEEVIECGLQMVDLHHQEQNAAPQIVALVSEGDFDAALKRIEQFGGSDLVGIQRKFSLYMLCLLELIYSEIIDKEFIKFGFGKLLNHLENNLVISEQMLLDQPSLDWRNFFPSKIIYIISNQSFKLGIDCSVLFRWTRFFSPLNAETKQETELVSNNNNVAFYSKKQIVKEIDRVKKNEDVEKRDLEIQKIVTQLLEINENDLAEQLLHEIDDSLLKQISSIEFNVKSLSSDQNSESKTDTIFENLIILLEDDIKRSVYLPILIAKLVTLDLRSKIPIVLKLESKINKLQVRYLPKAVKLLIDDSKYDGASYLINSYFDKNYECFEYLFSMNLSITPNSIPFFKTTILKFVNLENNLSDLKIYEICLNEISNRQFKEEGLSIKNYVNSHHFNNSILSIIFSQVFTLRKYKKINELLVKIKGDELRVIILSTLSTSLAKINKPNCCQKLISEAVNTIYKSQESDKLKYWEYIFTELILQEDSGLIIQFLEELKDVVYTDFIYKAIMRLVRFKQLSPNNKAIPNLIDVIKSDFHRCLVLLDLSFLAYKEELVSKSKGFFERFMQESNFIKEEWETDMIKMHHSSYLISTNRTNEGLQVIDRIRDPNFKSSAWRVTGDRFSQLHDLRIVLQFAKKIKDADYRDKYLFGVIKNIDFDVLSSKSLNLLLGLSSNNPQVLFTILTGLQYHDFFSDKKELDPRLGIQNNQWAIDIKKQFLN